MTKERVVIPTGRARSQARNRLKMDHSHHMDDYIAYLLDRLKLAHEVKRANEVAERKMFGDLHAGSRRAPPIYVRPPRKPKGIS
jgi:hypothetical protein